MGKGQSLTQIHFTVEVIQRDCTRKHPCTHFPQVKAGCVYGSFMMDDAHKHYSKRRPMEEAKVILPLT